MSLVNLAISYACLSGLFYIVGVSLPDFLFHRKRVNLELTKLTLLSLLLVFSFATLYWYRNTQITLSFLAFTEFKPLSIFLVLLINTVLFLYVILLYIYTGTVNELTDKFEYFFSDYQHFKAFIIAPLIEELYFRLLFVILADYHDLDSPLVFCLISSFFFAIPHLGKRELNENIGIFIMTFVFGNYCAYVLLATQTIWPCILLHSYCNFLGPPKPIPQTTKPKERRTLNLILFTSVLLSFALLAHLWN